MPLDFAVLNYIQENLRCDLLDGTIPPITKLGDAGAVWIALTVVLLLAPKTRRAGAAMAAALVLEALVCNLGIKPLVGRTRPCDVNTAIQLLIDRPADFSFPSGHTGASFAAVGALYFSRCRLWGGATVLAVLISFSRLYLYVHYPSDVLAGALLGIMAGWCGAMLVRVLCPDPAAEQKLPR